MSDTAETVALSRDLWTARTACVTVSDDGTGLGRPWWKRARSQGPRPASLARTPGLPFTTTPPAPGPGGTGAHPAEPPKEKALTRNYAPRTPVPKRPRPPAR